MFQIFKPISHLTLRWFPDVSWNPLREGGVVLLGEALRRSEGHGQLQNLNVEHCHVSEGACVLLAELLSNYARLNTLLICDT